MTGVQTTVFFVRQANSRRWRIESRDFAAFRQALGADVVNGFARCFVHADRLTSLIGFAYLSERQFGQASLAFSRDLQTMVWFVVGTLRELALAIRDLRSALAKRGLLDANAGPWVTLRDIEDRWEDNPLYREMRNIVAFHVDPDVTERGLEALAKSAEVVMVEGEGDKQRDTRLKLGLEAVFMGCDIDLAGMQGFMSSVGSDQAVSVPIQEAFVLTLKAAGVSIEEAPHGA